MEKLIVVKSGVAYGYDGNSGTTIDDRTDINTGTRNLADGALALFGEDGTLLLANTTAFTEIDVFEGRTAGGPIFHGTIYPREFKSITSTWVDAVTKIVALGSNANAGTTYTLHLPTVLVTGTVAGIQIIDKSKRHDDTSRYHNYETTAIANDTHVTLIARLIAKINADTKRCITSCAATTTSALTTGVLFTGKTLIDFSVSGQGLLVNADQIEYKNIIYSTTATKGYLSTLTSGLAAFSTGINTTAKMLAAEKETNVGLGSNGQVDTVRNNSLFTLPSRLEAGVDYLIYTITCKSPNNMGGLIEADNFTNTFHIAVDAGDSAIIAIIGGLITTMDGKSY